jgi:hypothetical protein
VLTDVVFPLVAPVQEGSIVAANERLSHDMAVNLAVRMRRRDVRERPGLDERLSRPVWPCDTMDESLLLRIYQPVAGSNRFKG